MWGIPAYCIFHNKTLEIISKKRPKSYLVLTNITGVGSKKSRTYGKEIFEIVNGS